MKHGKVAVRWTIGDVTDFGFEALRLSVWGAWRLLGSRAKYVICVNSLGVEAARRRTGRLPPRVEWLDNSELVPDFIRETCDERMAEGVGWKLAPLRLFPDAWEISLDNDVILWELPRAVREFLETGEADRAVIAEDVKPAFGQFSGVCGPRPRNSGIRGLAPGFDYGRAVREMLEGRSGPLTSELDEQGLQVAALERHAKTKVVPVEEVTICSPFFPHQKHLGSRGAHFVGLNTKHLPWRYFERPADECKTEHWLKMRPALIERVQPE